jgi:hypothetical protein
VNKVNVWEGKKISKGMLQMRYPSRRCQEETAALNSIGILVSSNHTLSANTAAASGDI